MHHIWNILRCVVIFVPYIACNSAPFLVAFISTDDESYIDVEDGQVKRLLRASVYSSETWEWSSPVAIHISLASYLDGRPCVVIIGQALFCLLHGQTGLCILKYDLGRHSLSVIDLPKLLLADDGGLVFVNQDQHGLCTMWSRESSFDGGAVPWMKLTEIHLKTLLPISDLTPSHTPKLVSSVEGTDIVVVVVSHLGAFTVDLKSPRSRKLSSRPYKYRSVAGEYGNLFLYTSFSSPPGVVAEARACVVEVSILSK